MGSAAQSRWRLVVSILALAAALTAAFDFPRGADSGVVATIEAKAVSVDAGTSAHTARSPRSDTNANAKVRALIDSGQFGPPPGNTDVMFAATTPFSGGGKASGSYVPHPAGASDAPEIRPGFQPGLIAARTNDPSANNQAPASPRNDASAARAHALDASISQMPASDFETPPGVGSKTGG